MEVYLVQHGESKSEAEDPERRLTEKGRSKVESVARYVADLGIKVSQVVHSDRLRAKQTAEIFAQHLKPPRGASEQEGLGPLDDPGKAKGLILEAKEPLMLVGHLPYLSRLASLLVLGDPEKEIVKSRMGGIVCLARSDNRWLVSWALTPELVR